MTRQERRALIRRTTKDAKKAMAGTLHKNEHPRLQENIKLLQREGLIKAPKMLWARRAWNFIRSFGRRQIGYRRAV